MEVYVGTAINVCRDGVKSLRQNFIAGIHPLHLVPRTDIKALQHFIAEVEFSQNVGHLFSRRIVGSSYG